MDNTTDCGSTPKLDLLTFEPHWIFQHIDP